MFTKSKKFAIPLIALFVACVAVEAGTDPDVPLPQICTCRISISNQTIDHGQNACAQVDQANGAVWDATRRWCQIGTESAFHSFRDACSKYSIQADAICNQDVNVPQSCSCANPSGINTAAQTQRACTLFGNLGTMVGDKCVVSTEAQYTGFSYVCSTAYPGSKAICSV